MNILIVAQYSLYQNFSNSFIHGQAKAYVALGHRVRVIAPLAYGAYNAHTKKKFLPTLEHETVDGVEIYYLRGIGKGLYPKVSFLKKTFRPFLRRMLDGFEPHIVHAHTFGISDFGAKISELLHLPLVITTHGSDTTLRYLAEKKEELCYYGNKANAIVAISTPIKQKLIDSGVQVPIHVILNGFRLNNVTQAQRKPHSIIQVSSLNLQKRNHITISALEKVRRVYPDATLTIVGDGAEHDRLVQQVNDLGLTDSVVFTGMLSNEQVMERLAETEVFCMPSVNEGFGIVYLEAMASGCYTIGTSDGGIADFIVDGKNGGLIPPDDVDSTASAILAAFSQPQVLRAVAQQGQRDAEGMTWERNAQANIDLFKTLID